MKISDFIDGRGVTYDTVRKYIVNHPELFKGHIGRTNNIVLDDVAIEILEKKYGVVVKTSKETIFARGASAEMAERLGIKEGEPVLVRKRFVLDRDNIPVEYNIGYYRADSFAYSIEFTND